MSFLFATSVLAAPQCTLPNGTDVGAGSCVNYTSPAGSNSTYTCNPSSSSPGGWVKTSGHTDGCGDISGPPPTGGDGNKPKRKEKR